MGRINYSLFDCGLFNINKHNEEELHHKRPIRSSKMLSNNFKYLFDYPKGFTLEDCKTLLELVSKEDDPFSVMRMVFPKYFIQITFCDNGDLIFHISEKSKYNKHLVKYIRYVEL